jgi:hypothetical protein
MTETKNITIGIPIDRIVRDKIEKIDPQNIAEGILVDESNFRQYYCPHLGCHRTVQLNKNICLHIDEFCKTHISREFEDEKKDIKYMVVLDNDNNHKLSLRTMGDGWRSTTIILTSEEMKIW